MTRRPRDLTGIRYGRLVVLDLTEHSLAGHVQWRCQCDCGEVKIVTARNLAEGVTRSCGCLRRDLASDRASGRAPRWDANPARPVVNVPYEAYLDICTIADRHGTSLRGAVEMVFADASSAEPPR